MKARVWVITGAAAAGLLFCALAVVFVVAHSNPALKESLMLFTSEGHPSRFRVVGSSIRVGYEWGRSSMLIPTDDPDVLKLLETARDAAENVSFRVQLAGSHFDADDGLPVFRVQSLSYREKTFGPYAVEVPWSWRVLTDEQVALLEGIGHHNNRDYNAALTQFDKALGSGKLRPAQRGLAMALRAEVYLYKAYAEPARVGKDYLLVRASEDYAEAVKYRKDDFSLLTSRAGVLTELGAYEEALSVLEPVLKLSGEMHFRAGILAADVLRRRDRHAEALKVLDDVGERDTEMLGMMYYYHRGWTLLLLDRNPEASAAFSNGLESQRGWPWVYIGRACARSRMGDLESAQADLRTAVEITDNGVDRDGEDSKSLRAELRNNIAALGRGGAQNPASLSVCEHFQPGFDRPLRERSKLLDTARAT